MTGPVAGLRFSDGTDLISWVTPPLRGGQPLPMNVWDLRSSPDDAARWLFGVFGYRWLGYGSNAVGHELFHAVQDFTYGLFTKKGGWLRSLIRAIAAEYAAHLWGGPLIGLPLAYGGTLFILGGLCSLAYLITLLFR